MVGTPDYSYLQPGYNHGIGNPDTGYAKPFTDFMDSVTNGALSGAKQVVSVVEDYGQGLFPVPLDPTLGQTRYNFNQRTFPLDLGSQSSYNGHYIVININVQNTTKMGTVGYRGKQYSTGTPFPSGPNNTAELSKTDALRYNIDNSFSGTDPLNPGLGGENQFSARPRFTKRIVESIALYMPNSELTFTDAHDYTNISLTKFAGSLLSGAATTIAAFVGGRFGGMQGASDAANATGTMMDALGNIIGSTSQLAGVPINPKVEVLFANTFQREFAFEFLFSPTSPEEAKALHNIIRTLRYHAAPEKRGGAIGSFFWVPPSEFDITFFNRGVENTSLPRINTCVLKQIDVSYSPTGTFSTFRDGFPTQIRMALRFLETEVAHKLRVLQGF